MDNLTFSDIRRGSSTVSLHRSPNDPLDDIAVVQVIDGLCIQATGVLTDGEVIHDYLA
jgi:acetoacetate decarboxylase